MTSCLYALLPDTLETQRAKDGTELLSEVVLSPVWGGCRLQTGLHGVSVFPQVKYRESGRKERSSSLYSTLPDTLETSFAREMTELQSEVRTGAASCCSLAPVGFTEVCEPEVSQGS